MSIIRKYALSAFDLAKRVVRDYSADNGSLMAAAISFYSFLSLIPLVLLCASIGAMFLGSVEQAHGAVTRLASEYYPAASGEAADAVKGIVDEIVGGRAVVTWISAIFLLWSGMTLTNSISGAINAAWNTSVRRKFLAQKLTDLFLLLATIALLGASLAMTAFIELVSSLNIHLLGFSPKDFPLLWRVLIYLVPLVVTSAAFTLVYKTAPTVRVPMRVALAGGVFSGVMWELAKQAFRFYVPHLVSSYSVYGSLGSILLLLIWINYSSTITILGAEVASERQKRRSREG